MKKFITNDNKKIEVNIYGSKGSTLILLAGWTHDFQYENSFINKLATNHVVITFSYPGYAQSEENYKAQSAKFLSNIISSVTHFLNIEDFTLIGFSMGCQIVVNYLQDHPKQKAVLISPILHSLIEDTPAYGKLLLSSSFLINLVRKTKIIKSFLVNKAYSNIGKVTENAKNRSQFKAERLSLNGAYDTLIATLTSFIDPVEYKSRIKFIFGDGEVMQSRLDNHKISYSVIKESGHGSFEENYDQIVKLIS
jgi:pimeloyl-ACP methyl ester carboxylesterase